MSEKIFKIFKLNKVGPGDIRKADVGICPRCESRNLRDVSSGGLYAKQCTECLVTILIDIK